MGVVGWIEGESVLKVGDLVEVVIGSAQSSH